jgi:hypothetical protein
MISGTAMPDTVDLAQMQQEMLEALQIQVRKPAGPPATGVCLYCGEPLPAGRRWCDAACRDDWQARKTAVQLRGTETS